MNIVLGKFIDAVITDEQRDQIDSFGQVMFSQFGSAACEVQGAGPEQSEAIRADFNRLLELLSITLRVMTFCWVVALA